MKVCIDGHRFDTDKARNSWSLSYFDGSNYHTGQVYLSSKGTWYVETPSQWSNGHSWVVMDPQEILDEYGNLYLTDEEQTEIAELAGLEYE